MCHGMITPGITHTLLTDWPGEHRTVLTDLPGRPRAVLADWPSLPHALLTDWLIVELNRREAENVEPGQQAHIINIEIQDNHEEATIGAFLICDLCAMVSLSMISDSGCCG